MIDPMELEGLRFAVKSLQQVLDDEFLSKDPSFFIYWGHSIAFWTDRIARGVDKCKN